MTFLHYTMIFFWSILLSSGLLPKESLQASTKPTPISGWPILELNHRKAPDWLGNEPVFGRLACPPFSRLNLKTKISEGLIFSHIKTGKNRQNEVLWKYQLRDGIYWWSGEKLRGQEVAAFMNRELKHTINTKGAGLWKIPPFKISSNSLEVMIHWQKKPVFGPYIFNGVSLTRPAEAKRSFFSSKKKAFHYECVGVYKPQILDEGYLLTPNQGYKFNHKAIYIPFSSNPNYPEKKEAIKFTMADSFAAKNLTRGEPYPCKAMIDLPFLTLISWNTQKKKLANLKLRRILTKLTPRGALLRSGTGHAGNLISSLIPKNHPGYSQKAYLRSFDLASISKKLNKLGYIRPQGDKERLDFDKKPMHLKILSNRSTPGILEKVLIDSFMAVGINISFISTKENQKSKLNDIDGVLTGVLIPWPEMNFLAHFHSRKPNQFPFWHLNHKKFDQLLESYALSLSNLKPDFAILKKIHQELYDLEPVTVIMQHKACLEAGKKIVGRVDNRDPDWFRKIVL